MATPCNRAPSSSATDRNARAQTSLRAIGKASFADRCPLDIPALIASKIIAA